MGWEASVANLGRDRMCIIWEAIWRRRARGRYTPYVRMYGTVFLLAGIFVSPAANECTLEQWNKVAKKPVKRKGNVVQQFMAPFWRP